MESRVKVLVEICHQMMVLTAQSRSKIFWLLVRLILWWCAIVMNPQRLSKTWLGLSWIQVLEKSKGKGTLIIDRAKKLLEKTQSSFKKKWRNSLNVHCKRLLKYISHQWRKSSAGIPQSKSSQNKRWKLKKLRKCERRHQMLYPLSLSSIKSTNPRCNLSLQAAVTARVAPSFSKTNNSTHLRLLRSRKLHLSSILKKLVPKPSPLESQARTKSLSLQNKKNLYQLQ